MYMYFSFSDCVPCRSCLSLFGNSRNVSLHSLPQTDLPGADRANFTEGTNWYEYFFIQFLPPYQSLHAFCLYLSSLFIYLIFVCSLQEAPRQSYSVDWQWTALSHITDFLYFGQSESYSVTVRKKLLEYTMFE